MVERDEVVTILDPQRRSAIAKVKHFDVHRLQHLFILDQSRRRPAIGKEQPIADEVAVVGLVAEVAPVAEVGTAVRCRLADTVVEPLPDAPSNQTVVAPEGVPIVGESAGTVAHGMAIFAEEERLVAVFFQAHTRAPGCIVADIALALPEGNYLRYGRIHLADHVADLAVAVAFIVDRAVRIVLTRPGSHRLVVGAEPRLVTQRPHDHAGMILIP